MFLYRYLRAYVFGKFALQASGSIYEHRLSESLSLYICLSTYGSIYLSILYLYVCLSVCLFVSIPVYVYIYIYVSRKISNYTYVYMCIYTHICVCLRQSEAWAGMKFANVISNILGFLLWEGYDLVPFWDTRLSILHRTRLKPFEALPGVLV